MRLLKSSKGLLMNIYESKFNEPSLDEVSDVDMYKLFNEYKAQKTIKSKFDSNIWSVTDGVKNYNMRFEPEEYPYENLLPKNDFIKYLKFFFLINYSKVSFLSLQATIRLVMFSLKSEETDKILTTTNGYLASLFFHTLPVELPAADNIDDAVENLKFNYGGQRTLSEIRSYFIFDEILNDFWKSETDEATKLFYFPLWFWWQITGVIPTRPTEILVTQRNCLTKVKNEYYITLRKSTLKGHSTNKKVVHHTIDKDYSTGTFLLPKRLAKEIEWYVDKTNVYPETELKTLLITDAHYNYLNYIKTYKNRYYTYANLKTCLYMFYENIIMERYHYEVVDEDKFINLGGNKIGVIQLGDTRHIALINLAIEGGSPWIMMALAGHNNMQIASHYYSNVSKVLECSTWKQLIQQNKELRTFAISNYKTPIFGRRGLKIQGGYCFSEKYSSGDFSDCLNVLTDEGEIGNCVNCPLFRKDSITFEMSKNLYIEKIKDSSELMFYLINKARTEKGLEDEVNKAQIKLNNDILSYRQYLLETREFENGKE